MNGADDVTLNMLPVVPPTRPTSNPTTRPPGTYANASRTTNECGPTGHSFLGGPEGIGEGFLLLIATR